jgi:hypothetical protein
MLLSYHLLSKWCTMATTPLASILRVHKFIEIRDVSPGSLAFDVETYSYYAETLSSLYLQLISYITGECGMAWSIYHNEVILRVFWRSRDCHCRPRISLLAKSVKQIDIGQSHTYLQHDWLLISQRDRRNLFTDGYDSRISPLVKICKRRTII